MLAAPRTLSLALMFVTAGCAAEPDEPTATAVESTSSTAAGSTAVTTGATATDTASGATTVDDGCSQHAIGGWNACKIGNQVNNDLCEWAEGGGEGMLLCLAPTSGAFNVCGIRDCVDVCDCFAPPATGTAVPVCAPILGGGANACALYCAGGQTCPDGMMCQSGYCYWPN